MSFFRKIERGSVKNRPGWGGLLLPQYHPVRDGTGPVGHWVNWVTLLDWVAGSLGQRLDPVTQSTGSLGHIIEDHLCWQLFKTTANCCIFDQTWGFRVHSWFTADQIPWKLFTLYTTTQKKSTYVGIFGVSALVTWNRHWVTTGSLFNWVTGLFYLTQFRLCPVLTCVYNNPSNQIQSYRN